MTPLVAEFGLGTSLRRGDYTGAAERAVRHALWRNSINLAELMGFEKADMIIEVTVAVQEPDAVDIAAIEAVFPYGTPRVRAVFGGLDVPRADGTQAVMAQAALVVGFEMERTCSA